MYHNTSLAICVTVAATKAYNSCQIQLTEKRGVLNSRENVRLVNKNYAKVNNNNNNKKRNLIPTEYRRVFWTLLGSQKKFDNVIDKVITKLDELDQPVAIKVKETAH